MFIINDREVYHECVTCIRVGGRIVNMIRYADDKAVVASSQKGLQDLMNRLNTVTKEYDMRTTVKKQIALLLADGLLSPSEPTV